MNYIMTYDDFVLYERTYQYSSTQFNIEGELKNDILKYVNNTIKKEDVFYGELGSYGKETEPHITIQYGLHTSNIEDIQLIVEGFGPVYIEFGQISMFGPNKDFYGMKHEVLKIDIKSTDIQRLHNVIHQSAIVTDKFPNYKPHLTLAYLKPSKSRTYIKNDKDMFVGKTATFNQITFSPKLGEKELISLL